MKAKWIVAFGVAVVLISLWLFVPHGEIFIWGAFCGGLAVAFFYVLFLFLKIIVNKWIPEYVYLHKKWK